MIRPPRFRLGTLMLAIAGLAVLFGYLAFALLQCQRAKLPVAYHTNGVALVIALEGWRYEHGAYPNSLADAAGLAEYTFGCKYKYEKTRAGFVLSIGEQGSLYGKHDYHSGGLNEGWRCSH